MPNNTPVQSQQINIYTVTRVYKEMQYLESRRDIPFWKSKWIKSIINANFKILCITIFNKNYLKPGTYGI